MAAKLLIAWALLASPGWAADLSCSDLASNCKLQTCDICPESVALGLDTPGAGRVVFLSNTAISSLQFNITTNLTGLNRSIAYSMTSQVPANQCRLIELADPAAAPQAAIERLLSGEARATGIADVLALDANGNPIEPSVRTCSGYAFASKAHLRTATRAWCRKRSEAEAVYGSIEGWDISAVSDLSWLFKDERECNPPIGSWRVSHVTDMTGMFDGAQEFNMPIGKWDVRKVQSMAGMMYNAWTFDQDISSWPVGSVTDMTQMFGFALAFNQNISGWDVCKVKSFYMTFFEASAFSQALCWDTTNARAKSAFDGSSGRWTPTAKDDCPCSREDPVPVAAWIMTALLAVAVTGFLVGVLVGLLVTVSVEPEPVTLSPTAAPTTTWELVNQVPASVWESIKSVFGSLTGQDSGQIRTLDPDSPEQAGGRRSSGSSLVQIQFDNPTAAYAAIQVLSSVSSSTLTYLVVQELQVTNYTGPMPTMITSVIQHVSSAGNGSESASMTLVIALAVAGGLLLLAALVVGALIYLWRANKSTCVAAKEEAAQAGVTVGVNPMCSEATDK